MMKNILYKTLFLLVLVTLPLGASTTTDSFTLDNYDGEKISLSDFSDSKAVVLMFVSTQCPVSNAYNGRMATLQNEYSKKGVTFVGINSNKSESVNEIAKHAKKSGFDFPVLKDEKNVVADKFKASVTPEVYVLNKEQNVLYQGRIDDSRRESEIKSHDLKNALDLVLAGKAIANNKTKAFGCGIKRVN
jgi:peroxiredoxin